MYINNLYSITIFFTDLFNEYDLPLHKLNYFFFSKLHKRLFAITEYNSSLQSISISISRCLSTYLHIYRYIDKYIIFNMNLHTNL